MSGTRRPRRVAGRLTSEGAVPGSDPGGGAGGDARRETAPPSRSVEVTRTEAAKLLGLKGREGVRRLERQRLLLGHKDARGRVVFARADVDRVREHREWADAEGLDGCGGLPPDFDAEWEAMRQQWDEDDRARNKQQAERARLDTIRRNFLAATVDERQAARIIGTSTHAARHHADVGDLEPVRVPMELANEHDVRDLHKRYTRESALALRERLHANVAAAAPVASALGVPVTPAMLGRIARLLGEDMAEAAQAAEEPTSELGTSDAAELLAALLAAMPKVVR